MYRRMYLYYAGILLYGSILPFNFEVVSFQELWVEFRNHSEIRFEAGSLEEMLVNYFLYLPLGFLLALSSTVSARPGRRYFTAAILGLLTSATAELMQGFLPGRYASFLDLFLNTSGAVAGAAIAEIWTYGIRSSSLLTIRFFPGVATKYHLRTSRLTTALASLGALLYSVLLFGSFASVPDSFSTVYQGLPQFFQIPFTDFQKLNYLQVLRNGTVKLVLFLPLGFLLAVAVHSFAETHRRRVKAWYSLLPVLIVFCLSIEWMQLGVLGKTASISDSCFYLVGIFSGALSLSLYRAQVVEWRRAARRIRSSARPVLVAPA